MRVLMVSDVYFPRINGVSTAIQTYREALADCGVEVSLVAPDYGQPCEREWVTRVPARPVPRDPEDRLAGWRAMRAAVGAAARGCDVIHVQTPFVAHYAGLAAARRLGLPVVATYHTLFEEYLQHYAPFVPAALLRSAARRFSRAQCNALDAVIVPSQAIHRRLGDYGVKSPRHVLPTGIPLARFRHGQRERFRAAHGIAPWRSVALFVGRVAHEKNIDFLLDVVDRARREKPDILLLVAGEGPALGGLQRTVARRGLEPHVRFLGYLDRDQALPDCYAAADVFVFASRTETQGLVLLEAMAAGLPVVALAEMGTLDILGTTGGGRGARVPRHDAEDFSRQLLAVLDDAELRQQLGREARAYAAGWSDLALAQRLAALYRQLASERRRGRP